MIALDYSVATGIVTSTSSGLLTVEEIRRATHDVRALLGRARTNFGRALYLVDARSTVVQTREVIDAVAQDGSHLSHPDDRMAVVLPTALTSMQTRRIFVSTNERVFHAMDDAITWLQAD